MERSREAWRAARSAADAAGVSLVPLTSLADAARVSSVIEQVWGPEQGVPPELLRAFQHAGVVLYGARSEDRFVGFVLGFLGFAGGIHLHSHMLAVVPGEEGHGTGYALKLAQRAACLDQGIEEVRWTFDPLVARNAWFNLGKLGTVAFRYLPGFYGEMTDRLNRGDRSDRFEVRWALTSERVGRAIAGQAAQPSSSGPPLLIAQGDPEVPRPASTDSPPGPGTTVQIPRDHQAIKARDPALASSWRESAGRVFARCFAAGLVATWFSQESGYVFEVGDTLDG
jgi:predicted GNAT superfamily acetyltransferase